MTVLRGAATGLVVATTLALSTIGGPPSQLRIRESDGRTGTVILAGPGVGGLGEKICTTVVFSGLPVALVELDDISAPVERTQRGHRGGGCEPASSESTSTAYQGIAKIPSPLNS